MSSTWIGQGAFASVHTHPECPNMVVKTYDDHYEDYLMGIKEVTITQALDHPHIIKFKSISLFGGDQVFTTHLDTGTRVKSANVNHAHGISITMPHYKTDLFNYIHHHALSASELHSCLCHILLALHYMHHLGIAHGDLKPNNVVLNTLDDLVLIDFGQSYMVDDDIHSEYTQTICYRAPEIILTSKFTTATDIWALGCIVFECLTKTLLFPIRDADAGARELFESLFAYFNVEDLKAMETLSKNDRKAALMCAITVRKQAMYASKSLAILHDIPELWIDIMVDCLHPMPDQRPSAANLLQRLGKDVPDTHTYIPLSVSTSCDEDHVQQWYHLLDVEKIAFFGTRWCGLASKLCASHTHLTQRAFEQLNNQERHRILSASHVIVASIMTGVGEDKGSQALSTLHTDVAVLDLEFLWQVGYDFIRSSR